MHICSWTVLLKCMHVSVCMCVCMHVCVCARVYVYVHSCIYMCAYLHLCLYVCMSVCTQGLAYTQIYTQTDTCHTNIHTHTCLVVAGATRSLVYHEYILSGIKLYSWYHCLTWWHKNNMNIKEKLGLEKITKQIYDNIWIFMLLFFSLMCKSGFNKT